MSGGIGELNPFRYRSYYLDTETYLYYLQTRYYDPDTGRFISQDSIEYADPETINGLNLYAYCGNNPVMNVDPTGNAWWHWVIAAVVVVALVAATIVTAGGAAAGIAALSAAACGSVAAGASLTTTVLAFASVGAGVALAASGIVATINAIDAAVTTGSLMNGVSSFMNEGESAMWATVTSAVISGLGGYTTYRERIGNSSQMGYMNNSQRGTEKSVLESTRETRWYSNSRYGNKPYIRYVW